MSAIEDAVAFVGVNTFIFGALNVSVCWGSKFVQWIPSHSVLASGIAGGLSGVGSGLAVGTLAFFPKQVEHFWKSQQIDSARMRYLMKRILVFSLPFFMTLLFTKPLAALVGRDLSLRQMAAYATLDAYLSLYGYNQLKK